MIDDPLLRIFHIDTECYIVYLGKVPEDYRPFLRVGNSPHLPEKVKSFIASVVVTDSLTGNQLQEHENLQLPLNGETRYIGDPAEVNKLKQFLEEKDLPVEGYEYEDDEDAPKKGGAYVYFYKNGNIHIVHDKQPIFNLHDRERKDGHFVYRAERVVQYVKSNPFRYLPWDLADPGFFLAGDKPYFFRDGKIGTVGIAADYIVDLGRYGFDPDLVLWLVEDRLSEGLLRRFKRATVTKRDLRVATSELRKLQSAVSLFTASGLSCIVLHLEPGERKVFSGFAMRRGEGGLELAFPEGTGFPDVVFPEGGESGAEDFGRRLVKKLGYSGKGFAPIEGIPYRIIDRDGGDPAAQVKTYLLEIIEELKDVGGHASQDFLKTVGLLCKAVLAAPGNSASRPLYDTREKNLGASLPDEFQFLLWNIRELSRLWSSRRGVAPGIKKNGIRLESLVQEPRMPRGNQTRLPVLGDMLRLDGAWYVLYRWNGVLSSQKLLQAQKSVEGIEKQGFPDNEAFYLSERERLLGFIEGLSETPAKRRTKSVSAEEAIPPPPAEKPSPASAIRPPDAAAADKPGRPKDKTYPPAGAVRSAGGGLSIPSLRPYGGRQGGRTGGGFGKAIVPVLAVLAAGGVAFLVLRECSGRELPGAAVSARPETRSSDSRPGAPVTGGAVGETSPGSRVPDASASGGEGVARSPAPETAAVPGAGTESVPSAPTKPSPEVEFLPEIDPESIPITILDVYYLVNEVADANGYQPLDRPEDLRPDPDWIYPGETFVLPDKEVYAVRTGDTLWGISSRFIRKSIREQAAAYGDRINQFRPGPVPPEKKEETGDFIRNLIRDCRSENLRRIFEEKLKILMEEKKN